MKTIKLTLPVLSVILLSSFTVMQVTNWKVTNDYSIKFSGTDAEGVFQKFTGDIHFDESDLSASKCVLSIDVNSINTGNGMKNKHAVSSKWFDAENYPVIEFESTDFSKTDAGYMAKGTLKMHGIEREVEIPFTFEDNVFSSQFSVNRLDYEVGTMKGSSKKVSNEIKLDISIPVTEG